MIRRATALVVVVVALVAGCRSHDNGWHPSAPFAPSLRPAFGARVTDGQLQIWTGSRCVSVASFTLHFERRRAELELSSRAENGAEVENFAIGGPYPAGMDVAQPLPEGFDWRNEESMRISIYGSPTFWGSSTDLAEVIKGSSEHPPDTYWFQDVGWLNPADVAAKDGKTFLATCTPDPAKQR